MRHLKLSLLLATGLAAFGIAVHPQTRPILVRGQSLNYSACVSVTFTPAADGSEQSIATIANGCGATIPLLSIGLKWLDSSGVRINEETLNPIINLNPSEKEQVPVSNWTGADGQPAKIVVREIASVPPTAN